MNIEQWLDNIPEGVGAVVFDENGGIHTMVPNVDSDDDTHPTFENLILCAAITNEKYRHLADQILKDVVETH